MLFVLTMESLFRVGIDKETGNHVLKGSVTVLRRHSKRLKRHLDVNLEMFHTSDSLRYLSVIVKLREEI